MSPTCYRLVVVGELGPRYRSAFAGMTLRAHDGETDITGPISDQSQLQGVLERITSLGLTLHSVTPVESDVAAVHPQPHTQPAAVTDQDLGAHSKGP